MPLPSCPPWRQGDNSSLYFPKGQLKIRNIISDKNPDYRYFNPIALRKAKIVYNFGLSDCNRVKHPDQ